VAVVVGTVVVDAVAVVVVGVEVEQGLEEQ